MKKSPEARDYRGAMAAALKEARAFDGTEARYTSLMQSLEDLEETVQTTPSLESESLQEMEIETALKFAPLQPRVINDVLGIAEESRRNALRKAIEEKEASKTGLLVKEIDAVILPPGTAPERGPGKGEPMKVPEFEKRVETFLRFLERNGVYADDVVLTIGKEPEYAMRKISYTHVEIPRINRTVLLCDQIGEATYVLKVFIDPASPWSKEELMQRLPDDCRVIVKHNQKHWEEQLQKYLFTDEAWGDAVKPKERIKTKIDVRERDAFRERVKQGISVREYLTAPLKSIRTMKFDGRGWQSIHSLFGLSGSIDNRKTRLEFSRLIWGEDDPEVQKWSEVFGRDAEAWKEVVRATFTPETWLKMKRREMIHLTIDDHGYYTLAKIFGVSVPANFRLSDHVRVGRVIWGESAFEDLYEDREYNPPKEDWVTYSTWAREVVKRSPSAVKNRMEKLKKACPEWFELAMSPRGKVLEYMSPEAAETLEKELAELGERQTSWGFAESDALEDLAEPPEGSKQLSEFARDLGKDFETVRIRMQYVRDRHPEWFFPARDRRSGKAALYILSEALQMVRAYFEDNEELERGGWMSVFDLARLAQTTPVALGKQLEVFREMHPEWFRMPLDPIDRFGERVSAEGARYVLENLQSEDKQKTRE